MDEYMANCPVSMPVNIPGLRPDADLGGLMFSLEMGLMYVTGADEAILREPQED